jgi:hypothetical protein
MICITCNILKVAWYLSAPDVKEIHKNEYLLHRETCPAARADMVEVTAQAAQAVHPELEEE